MSENADPLLTSSQVELSSWAPCGAPSGQSWVELRSPFRAKLDESPRKTSFLTFACFIRKCTPAKGVAFFLLAFVYDIIGGVLYGLHPTLATQQISGSLGQKDLAWTKFCLPVFGYIAVVVAIKVIANYCVHQFISHSRQGVMSACNRLYFTSKGRNYYYINLVDKSHDNADATCTNDIELMYLHGCEFALGGIFRAENGACYNLASWITFIVTPFIAGVWQIPLLTCLCCFVLTIAILLASPPVRSALLAIQDSEADLRSAHATVLAASESIAFYGGESGEETGLAKRLATLLRAWTSYALWSIPLDFFMLQLLMGAFFMSAIIGVPLANAKGASLEAIVRTIMSIDYFIFCVNILHAYAWTMRSMVDFTKFRTYSHRIIKLFELMEAFIALEDPAHKAVFQFEKRQSSEIVRVEICDHVEFVKCCIYTPFGDQLLLSDVSLRIAQQESCLIMGPSGCGKSSLLRVLGGLWPLFATPGAALRRPQSLFFLSQRPYLFKSSLREQVAYPVWDESLLTDLTDREMEDLFKSANLLSVWKQRQSQLDLTGIPWGDVLSLGEQQRLQFCRLFWHAKWHRARYRGTSSEKSFFAILDESTASLDADSEAIVYKHCLDSGFGFLSVAHRPTVIQYHTSVLQLSLDANGNVKHEMVKSEVAAASAAEKAVANVVVESSHELVRKSLAGSHAEVHQTGAPKTLSNARMSMSSVSHSMPSPLVRSPYDPDREIRIPGKIMAFLRVLSICMSPSSAMLLSLQICLAIGAGVLEGWWGPMFGFLTHTMQLEQPDRSAAMNVWIWRIFVWGLLKGIVKSLSNTSSKLVMTQMRGMLTTHLHKLYMDPMGQSYYRLETLLMDPNQPDQRITNDVDLLMQHMCEFWLGGILKCDAGVLFSFSAAITCIILVTHSMAGLEIPNANFYTNFEPALQGILFWSLTAVVSPFFVKWVAREQKAVQEAEAELRRVSNSIVRNAESICFYGGEATEHEIVDAAGEQVWARMKTYALWKIFLDIVGLVQHISIVPVPHLIGIRFAAIHNSIPSFGVILAGVIVLIRNLQISAQGFLDLAKATGYQTRVVELDDALRMCLLITSGIADDRATYCCCNDIVQRPACGELIEAVEGPSIQFKRCPVYTPNGLKLLVASISLEISGEQSCLIMGPSGIGKSSLLRLLGGLWPLFRAPSDKTKEASLTRPEKRSLFFLAQSPYIFNGTLREQVAYPVWEPSLLTDLTDGVMENLFKDANLREVWSKRKSQLDANDIPWSSVLSLGEQQRLQFCRLFWHAEWIAKTRSTRERFFAILDESTAALDMDSEMKVYKQCRERGIAFLSVAHRPTVIQYHSSVLRFYFDDGQNLQWENVEASKMASQAAAAIVKEAHKW